MLELFPQYKKRTLIFCILYLACIVMLCVMRQGIDLMILVLALLGPIVILVSQYINAANAHNTQLNKLYNQLDVEGFIRDYKPHLEAKPRNQNLAIMVRIHLSNAYAALGRFDEVIALLSAIKVKEGKRENMLLSRFAIVSNLCYCAEQKNDLAAAKTYLSELLGIKQELEAIQETKPMKKRMVFSTELNEQCMKLLSTGKADVDVLRNQVQPSNTQQLHRVTTSLWIARAELAQGNRREAENLLRQIVKLVPDLYPGQAAQALLNTLPAHPETDA